GRQSRVHGVAAAIAGTSRAVCLPAAYRPPEPPARGERRFHGPSGHFPPAAVNHPAAAARDRNSSPRAGGSWLPEVWGQNGLGESAPAPLRQNEVFTSRRRATLSVASSSPLKISPK